MVQLYWAVYIAFSFFPIKYMACENLYSIQTMFLGIQLALQQIFVDENTQY